MPALGITDGPPPCAHEHQAVVLSCSHLARRWVVLEHHLAWLVVDTQVKACSRETHSPSQVSKTYGHNAFRIIHIHTTVIQWSRAHYSTLHTLWAVTAATILADATVTTPSPKWPKNVSSGTLNLAQSITICCLCCSWVASCGGCHPMWMQELHTLVNWSDDFPPVLTGIVDRCQSSRVLCTIIL